MPKSKPSPSKNAQNRAQSARSAKSRPTAAPPKPTVRGWIGAARLRTLPLAVAPVALGTGAATLQGQVEPLLAWLCLAVAVLLQIGVNFANDYSDGVRGTDDVRVGPARLTASRAVKAKTVLIVALSFFGLAAVAGLAIVVITGIYWLLIVGAAAIVAAWFYTGGKHPYGYAGLGEIFVFIFFGLVATVGTMYVLVSTVSLEALLCGAAIGFIACAVLMANNIRDIAQDKLVGKKTLAVKVGDRAARILYVVFMAVPYIVLGLLTLLYPIAPLVFFTLLIAVPAALIVLTGKTAREFILALQLTSMVGLLYGLGVAAALAF